MKAEARAEGSQTGDWSFEPPLSLQIDHVENAGRFPEIKKTMGSEEALGRLSAVISIHNVAQVQSTARRPGILGVSLPLT